MSKADYKRVSLTFDFGTKVTDEEAIDEVIDRISAGEIMHWVVQTLPDLDEGRWIER